MNLELIDNFLQTYNQIESMSKEANREHSAIDTELSDFYHRIEGMKLNNVAKSHNLLKELQQILIRRREIKARGIAFRVVTDTLKISMKTVSEKLSAHDKKHQSILEEITEAGSK